MCEHCQCSCGALPNQCGIAAKPVEACAYPVEVRLRAVSEIQSVRSAELICAASRGRCRCMHGLELVVIWSLHAPMSWRRCMRNCRAYMSMVSCSSSPVGRPMMGLWSGMVKGSEVSIALLRCRCSPATKSMLPSSKVSGMVGMTNRSSSNCSHINLLTVSCAAYRMTNYSTECPILLFQQAAKTTVAHKPA